MNGQETEVKFYVQDLKKIEMRLLGLKAHLIQPRVHEINFRYDTPDNNLRKNDCVLRLRHDGKTHFTFKGPGVEKEGGVISRREIEFIVEDFESAKQFLEALGFEAVVLYEKYRTTYELNNTHIMLDELPYGWFVEIEGESADSIHPVANQLNLHWEAMVKAGYHTLFERIANKFDLDASKLTFAALELIHVTPEDLDVTPASHSASLRDYSGRLCQGECKENLL